MSTCIIVNATDTKKMVSSYINSFTCNYSEFTDAMVLENEEIQHNFTVLCLNWFIAISKVIGFDDRNEDSVKLGKRVAKEFHNETILYKKISCNDIPHELSVNYSDGIEVENVMSKFLCLGDREFELFIEKFLREHRTLQQNFSKLCIEWLNAVSDGKEKSQLTCIQIALKISRLNTGLRYI